ncbi:MAG: hypothetical protein ABIN80_28650 [Dyadobacter sp.]|uniref:hypothetical protein n=1 Tax=Dyadobacter sp. TaxID=1914288 RepID=UPI0032647969
MNDLQTVLDQVKARRLPYWKLYIGSDKIAECGGDENPTASIDVAAQLFEDELMSRQDDPGKYRVSVFRNINGDKSAFKHFFTIDAAQRPMSGFTRPQPNDYGEIYQRVQRDVKIEMSLERIEKKIDAIGDYILAKTTDNDKDDNKALDFLMSMFGSAMQKNAAAAAAKTAVAVTPGKFSAL